MRDVMPNDWIDDMIDRGEGLKAIAREAVKRAERPAIEGALAACRWNRVKAARRLRVSYRTLLYRIKDYGLRPRPQLVVSRLGPVGVPPLVVDLVP